MSKKPTKSTIKKINAWLVPIAIKHISPGPSRPRMINRVNGIVNERNWYAIAELLDSTELLDDLFNHFTINGDSTTAKHISDSIKRYKNSKTSYLAISNSPDTITRETKKPDTPISSNKHSDIYVSILDRPGQSYETDKIDMGERTITVDIPANVLRWELKSGLHNRKLIVFTYRNGEVGLVRLGIDVMATAELSRDRTQIIVKYIISE